MNKDKNKITGSTFDPLRETLNKCLESLYEVYFQPRPTNDELHYFWRFLCTFSGACAFHFWYYFISVRVKRKDDLENFFDSIDPNSTSNELIGDALYFIEISTAYTWANIVVGGAFALVYSLILASGFSRHGPTRYFLGGIMLSALVLFIASSVATTGFPAT